MVCKYFLFLGLLFHFLDGFLCRTQFFNFEEVQFICLLSCCFGHYLIQVQGFPGSSMGREAACSTEDTGDMDSIPGLGRSPGGGNGNPLQHSCLENPMDRSLVSYSPYGRKIGHD